MITNRKPVDWRFLLKWIFATSFGTLLITVGIWAMFGTIFGGLLWVGLSLIIISMMSLWVTVGLAQWSVLRRFINQRATAWVGATVLAFLFDRLIEQLDLPMKVFRFFAGGETPTEISPLVLEIVMGMILGTVLGTAQWFALRRKVHQAALWILLSSVSWTFAMLIASSIGKIPEKWYEETLELLLYSLYLPYFCGTLLSTLALWWFLTYLIPLAQRETREVGMVKP